MPTVACVLYDGDDVPDHSKGIFTPEWVDRLYRGIKRNTTHHFRFVCYTDKPRQFNEPVEQIPFKLPYRNMFSLLEPFGDDLGHVLFMGLDTVITGNIDHLMTYDGPFRMLQDPWFDRGCSGVMQFPYMPDLWADIEQNHEQYVNEATMFGYPSDMILLDRYKHAILQGPANGIFSYKAHIKDNPHLLKEARIIYFHGREKPHELDHDWIREHWGEPPLRPLSFNNTLNNKTEVMLSQFRENIKRDVPFFQDSQHRNGSALIVGGGPSLQDSLVKLRFHKDRGEIFALNGTHDWLIERGIKPDYHVLLDSRPENVCFVQNPQKGVKYYISAFCHPDVFEALRGYDVTLWMSDMDGVMPIVQEIHDKPVCLVGGGATVGMKTMYLTYLMGYRKFHFFGFDSSYRDDKNHAYSQPMNDKESRIEVTAAGKKFVCSPWMARQAVQFQEQARKLAQLGCKLTVHGDGLIPWIMQYQEQSCTQSQKSKAVATT